METGQIKKEQISAWLDGELPDADPNVMMAALDSPEGRAAWDEYHRIGDCLRSDELDITPSADFSRKLAEGLAAEPHWMVAPATPNRPAQRFKPWMWPGVAVAASVLVMLALPQARLGDATGSGNLVTQKVPAASPTLPPAQLVSSGQQEISVARASVPASISASAKASAPVLEGELLRDPQIDQYLMAHQRFSPAGYSAAHYARSASNRKTGTDK